MRAWAAMHMNDAVLMCSFSILCREMYIGHLNFCGLTAVVLGYILFVLSADARHKRVSFPFGPLRRVFRGGGAT